MRDPDTRFATFARPRAGASSTERTPIVIVDTMCDAAKMATSQMAPADKHATHQPGHPSAADVVRDALLAEARIAIALGPDLHIPADRPGVAEMRKDSLRRRLIALARLAVLLGTREIDCAQISSVERFCCEAVNDLLRAAGEGGNEWDAANSVIVSCGGEG